MGLVAQFDPAAGGGGGQPLDSDLTAIAALSTTAYGRAFLELADAAAARTSLGLGTAATAASTSFEVAGAAAAAQAASQPVDSDLTALAALATTTYGRSLLTLADAAAGRTALGLVRVTNAAYAATVTPNADTTDVLNIAALTGSLTVAAPTGTPVDGQTLRIRLLQDGTGGRVVTWNSAFAFGTDITAAMEPTGVSAKWERIFEWNATDSKWRSTGIARGF